jgi:ubiquinone/menaquinone biosynthesis C-methylase UbiE
MASLWPLLRGLAYFFLLIVAWLLVMKLVRRFYQFPIPGILTEVIDNPIRRRFIQNPGVIADRMHLAPGMTVVEVGPGKGSYTKAVAERVLPDGKVYAVDIQESIVERLKRRLEREGITNIIPMIGDAYAFSFEDESIDRVFAIACLPEIPDPVRVLRECRRILRPGGIVSLSELLPDADYPLRGTEKRWAKEAGLDFMEEYGNFFTYQLNFVKK